MYDIPCVIFAGGKSKRMKRDKALLPFGSHNTLTEFQLDKFKPYFKNVYVSAKHSSKFNFDADFIEDLEEFNESAPMIGLLSVFEQLGVDDIFVLSVDTPFFDIEHFEKLYKYIGNYTIIAKSSNKIHPLCAVYNREILQHLKIALQEKNYKLQEVFNKINIKFVEFDDEKIFTNLNYPKDYEKWSNI